MPASKPRVLVVGSLNMDLVLTVNRLPRPGETVTAIGLQSIHGGKGANQAVSLARLGAQVVMVGRVGDDSHGDQLRSGLATEGIDVEHVVTTSACPSGLAVIGVASSGENSIVIVPGANARLSEADIQSCQAILRGTDAIVIQNEVPLRTIAATATLARQLGVPVIYDPAPAPVGDLPDCLWAVAVLTPNQTEAESMAGFSIRSTEDALAAARAFRERGAQRVVIKLGERGAVALDSDNRWFQVPAARVEVVDTTAAGDAFTAAMTVALAEQRSFEEAVRWGCAAGTLTVMSAGAQPSLPTRSAVEQFLARAG